MTELSNFLETGVSAVGNRRVAETKFGDIVRFHYQSYLPPIIATRKMPNTVVYFDITIGSESAGRITFDLYDDVVPKVDLLSLPCNPDS